MDAFVYHELSDHQSACPHAPCSCPEPGCGFVSPPPALVAHLTARRQVWWRPPRMPPSRSPIWTGATPPRLSCFARQRGHRAGASLSLMEERPRRGAPLHQQQGNKIAKQKCTTCRLQTEATSVAIHTQQHRRGKGRRDDQLGDQVDELQQRRRRNLKILGGAAPSTRDGGSTTLVKETMLMPGEKLNCYSNLTMEADLSFTLCQTIGGCCLLSSDQI